MARSYQLKSVRKTGPTLDFASLLNAQQLEAATAKPGPALVIAGAGSGKTRTLTHRVAFLIEQGVDPGNILLLTFTNKAAKEMLIRVSELVPTDVMAIWGGTFHSVGSRILRKHGERLGFTRSFSIMDREDQNSLINLAVSESGIREEVRKEKRFPKAKVLADVYSIAQNLDRPMEEVLDTRYSHLEEFWEEIAQIQKTYERKKLDTNSLDFDDLLCKTLKLLETNEDLREGYQGKFRAILVDEYQDTNPVQSRMIDLLAGKHRHLMVVGDDAQSIYSWRGADYRNIMEFPVRFPEATVYKIETNYRSVPEVLALANESIACNVHQFEKELRPARESLDQKPAFVPLPDPGTQAMFVAQRMQELHDEEGIAFSEMAVLYRAHFQSMELQIELANRSIAYGITSGIRFFEQAHIKDVISFIRFVANPKDELAFKRMLKLVNGIGDVTANKLWHAWLSHEASASDRPAQYVKVLSEFKVPTRAQDGWKQLAYTLDELIQNGVPVSPSEMLRSVTEGIYADVMHSEFTNVERRTLDIETLGRFASQFENVEEFMNQLSLLTNADDTGKADKVEEDRVTLSSIHQAKGLEWKVVFVIWLAQGMFPHMRIISGDSFGEVTVDAMEEERRLFYVAVTRACDQLYLTYPMTRPGAGSYSYSGEYHQVPSQFIGEVSADLMEEWDVGGIW